MISKSLLLFIAAVYCIAATAANIWLIVSFDVFGIVADLDWVNHFRICVATDAIMTTIVLAPWNPWPVTFTDLGRLRLQECESSGTAWTGDHERRQGPQDDQPDGDRSRPGRAGPGHSAHP